MPLHKETIICGFQPDQTKPGCTAAQDNFGFRKKRDWNIYLAKTRCSQAVQLRRTSGGKYSTRPLVINSEIKKIRVILPKALVLYRTSAFEIITQGSHIACYSFTFFIAYTFECQVHVFARRVKIVSPFLSIGSQCMPKNCVAEVFTPLTNQLNWLAESVQSNPRTGRWIPLLPRSKFFLIFLKIVRGPISLTSLRRVFVLKTSY